MATLVHIVMTPGSGRGGATAVARDVRARLEREGYAARLQAFRTLGELVQWTRTCRATFSYLVAIGGDATVSAVAEAAVRLSVPLVPVPLGFGNLFTSAFEHPGEPDAVAALLGRGELVWADVGVAGGEMFLSHASYGYLARIQEDVERLHRPRQRYLRLLSYYRMAAKQLSDGALDSIQVEIDGHAVPGRAGLVTIANVETYRGFLSLTPGASPLDGVFDVCVIPRTTPARTLTQLIKVMLDLPGARDGIGLYNGRHVRVRVNRRRPEDVRILPGVLPLLVPAQGLERLRARQTTAQTDGPAVRPAPREPVASVRAPAAKRGSRSRSTPPDAAA
ncbi:MAG TPA: diacylglycerol kinase family protein [Methylomirabilota bacterium]|nr:diacylglycerol kinase family protein [Methylomirabilota bacterium]